MPEGVAVVKEIGERLRSAREAKGLSMREVQAETKIRQKYLEALENGDEASIPGEVYVKGFLRSYANHLGLDGHALVEQYKALKEAQRQQEQQAAEELKRRDETRGRPGRSVVVGILAVVVIFTLVAGGMYLLRQGGGGEGNISPNGTPATGQDPQGQGTDGGPVQPGQTAQDDTGPTTPRGLAVVRVSDRAEATEFRVSSSGLVVRAVGRNRCWVRVSADGAPLWEGTLTEGDSQTWQARDRLEILAGYPVGLELYVENPENPSESITLGRAGGESVKRVKFTRD